MATLAVLAAGPSAPATADAAERRSVGVPPMGAWSQIRDLPADFWKDPDGNPLPFQSDEQIIDFMRTAQVESVESIPVGITKPRRVVLAQDGVRMHAALRDFDREYEDVRFNGRFYWRIRDSYLFDIAAYELSKLLDLNNVPPVTLRRVNGVNASLQAWVEGALVESDRLAEGIAPPEDGSNAFFRQYQMVRVFDTLIGNVDRNVGNILFDAQWNFWLIDHSRAFLPDDRNIPYLEAIVICERSLFEGLESLDRQDLVERLAPPLRPSDVDWILKRRDKIVAHIGELIAEKGEAEVLFDSARHRP